MLVRIHPWKGGTTPYCRVHGSGYGGKIVRFGEKVMVLDPCETSKLQNRWLEGIWLGKAEESDEHYEAGNNEIGRYRSLRRYADQDSRAWDAQAVPRLTATPWEPKGIERKTLPTPTAPERVVSKKEFPPKPGCSACAKRGQASHGFRHSKGCKERFGTWLAAQSGAGGAEAAGTGGAVLVPPDVPMTAQLSPSTPSTNSGTQ